MSNNCENDNDTKTYFEEVPARTDDLAGRALIPLPDPQTIRVYFEGNNF